VCDRVDQHKKQIERTASRQTKWQIRSGKLCLSVDITKPLSRVLQHVMEGRSVTFRVCPFEFRSPTSTNDKHIDESRKSST
jgi:hypothetical protein